jgi:tetratricopeptide (TPR) repeat protein
MLTLKFPANFVSSLQLPVTSMFDLVGSNDASAQAQAIEARLREAQAQFRARRYQDAVTSYKTAQSLIYTALQPDHSIVGHALDDGVMLPVGAAIETALASASLKLAEAIQPAVLTPRAPVTVAGVQPPENLTQLASIGFRQDSNVPTDVSVATNVGLEHLAQGRIPQAIEVLTDLFDRIGQPSTPAANANAAAIALDLSSAKLVAGDFEEARTLAERAEGFFRAARDEAGQAQALHNQGVAFQRLDQPEKAKAAFDRAATHYESVAKSWGVRADGAGPSPAPATPGTPPTPGPAGPPSIRIPSLPPIHLAFGLRDSAKLTLGGLSGLSFVGTRPALGLTTPISAAGIISGAASGGIGGIVATRPPVASSAVPGTDIADLVHVKDRDASVVSVRWPGAGAGWGGTALPTPVEVQREERSWSLNVPAGNKLVSLVWKDGVRPTADKLLDGVYKRRLTAKTIGDLIFRPREPGELTAHLTHLYSFVVPQALGASRETSDGSGSRSSDAQARTRGASFEQDPPRPRQEPRPVRAGGARAALARSDVRSPAYLAAIARRLPGQRVVAGVLDATQADVVELRRDLPQLHDPAFASDDCRDRGRCHTPADLHRRARRVCVRVARVSRAGLVVHLGHRPARGAAADGADTDLQPLQHGRHLRHRHRADPLPHRVRPPVRGLPTAELLRRNPEGSDRSRAYRRRIRALHPSCA